jgi:hypothetical protein
MADDVVRTHRFDGVVAGPLELLKVVRVDPVLLQNLDALVRDGNLGERKGNRQKDAGRENDRESNERGRGCVRARLAVHRRRSDGLDVAALVSSLTSMASSPATSQFWSWPSIVVYSCCTCAVMVECSYCLSTLLPFTTKQCNGRRRAAWKRWRGPLGVRRRDGAEDTL